MEEKEFLRLILKKLDLLKSVYINSHLRDREIKFFEGINIIHSLLFNRIHLDSSFEEYHKRNLNDLDNLIKIMSENENNNRRN